MVRKQVKPKKEGKTVRTLAADRQTHDFYEGRLKPPPYPSIPRPSLVLYLPSSTSPNGRPAPHRSLSIPYRLSGSVFTFPHPRPRPHRSNCWLPRSLLADAEARLTGKEGVAEPRGKVGGEGGDRTAERVGWTAEERGIRERSKEETEDDKEDGKGRTYQIKGQSIYCGPSELPLPRWSVIARVGGEDLGPLPNFRLQNEYHRPLN